MNDTIDLGLACLASDTGAGSALAVAGAATLAAAAAGLVAVLKVGHTNTFSGYPAAPMFVPMLLVTGSVEPANVQWSAQQLDDASLDELTPEELTDLRQALENQLAKYGPNTPNHPVVKRGISELLRASSNIESRLRSTIWRN